MRGLACAARAQPQQVIDGRILAVLVEAAGMDEVRIVHAELLGAGIHALGKRSQARRRILDQHQAGIVGRMHEHGGQRLLGRDRVPGMQSDARMGDMGGVAADAEHGVWMPVGVEQHQRGQQLGQRGGRTVNIDITAPDQLAVDDGGIGHGGPRVGIEAAFPGSRPDLS